MKVITLYKEDFRSQEAFYGILRALGYGRNVKSKILFISLVVQSSDLTYGESEPTADVDVDK